MSVEVKLFSSLLKLTKEGLILPEEVAKDAILPQSVVEELLDMLQLEGLVYYESTQVGVTSQNRLQLAVRAVELGADVERVSACLRWQEFEDMAALALARNGYAVRTNVRFKHVSKRWEIDVVGCRKPLVLCIDCKHWHRGIRFSALKQIVALQVERAKVLAESLPNQALQLDCTLWKHARFVPVIVSLVQSGSLFHNAVPIVPVLRLQDFIHQLPAHIEAVQSFTREFAHLR
ncbi:MAG: hypothetical protein NWF04_03225 [Candidatus Bathyarchaeota archaeon]|nr:hypothetical protein [Candidatus Bathyarchaeota archaeon]